MPHRGHLGRGDRLVTVLDLNVTRSVRTGHGILLESRCDLIRTGPCPGPPGRNSSSRAPGYGDTLRPDTGHRQGRDPLLPVPHLKLAAEPDEPQQRGDDRPDE